MDYTYGQIWLAGFRAQNRTLFLLVPLWVEWIPTMALVNSGCSQMLIWDGLVPNLEGHTVIPHRLGKV